MEFRKIIAFGKSSFVVSLPKAWMVAHNLVKGDVVYLEEEGDDLKVMPSEKIPVEEENIVVVRADRKSTARIRREVCSAYLNNAGQILIKGMDLSEVSKPISKLINDLIALEVIESGNNVIVAKDFLRVQDLRIKDYLRKLDIIVRSMLSDLCREDFDDFVELAQRHQYGRKIYLLLLRVFKSAMINKNTRKNLDIPESTIIGYYRLVVALQSISRKIPDVSMSMMENVDSRNTIRLMVDVVYREYLAMMKVISTMDPDKAYGFSERREQLLSELEAIELDGSEPVIHAHFFAHFCMHEMHEVIHRVYS